MNEIIPYITPNSLVIFDIDNTVVTAHYDHAHPTEPELPDLIRNIQIFGSYPMALTARAFFLADYTRNQLKSIGVDFNLNPPYPFSINFKDSTYYTQGVFYGGPFSNKGDRLVTFLKVTNLMPSRIIFVDNTNSNVNDVENSLGSSNFEHFSFHYENPGW